MPSAGASRVRLAGLPLFIVLGSVSVIGPAAMDIYLPGLPNVAHDLHVTASAAQLTVTSFLVGLALGQLVAGPLSDVYGRRRPLITGMALFTLASAVCAVSPTLFLLSAMRSIQGITAAAGMVIGRAIVRDLYSGALAARYLSRLMLIVGLGPIVAPAVGGQILRFTSWHGVFVALAALGVTLVAVASRFLPETLPAERRLAPRPGQTVDGFRTVLVNRRFLGYAAICGFGGAAIFAYVGASAFVFEDVFGVSPQFYGVLFGFSAICLVIGAQVNAHLLRRIAPQTLVTLGLNTMLVSAVVVLAVAPFHGAGFVAILLPVSLLMVSWSFVQANALALALTDHPGHAGTAAALIGLCQYGAGALVVPLVSLGGGSSALPMGIVIGVCAIAARTSLGYLVRSLRVEGVVAVRV